jgi:hypothetical protein
MQGWFYRNTGHYIKETYIDLPERSFLRLTMHQKADDFRSMVGAQSYEVLFNQMIAGNLGEVLERFAVRWDAYVHEAFYTQGWGSWPALSSLTVELKGHSTPLRDTGALMNSIVHEVVNA